MDEVSFILLILMATIFIFFIKFLYQLYRDRGQLSVMVSDPVEEWAPGEFELPEYLHHSVNESQSDDCGGEPYSEYGLYSKPSLQSLTVNPLYSRTFNSLAANYHNYQTSADQRRVQFRLRPQWSQRSQHNKQPETVPVEVLEVEDRSGPDGMDVLEAPLQQPRRESFASCLTCELIKMGSASPYADNSCPQCGRDWSN